jgi:hypothetical protein
MLASRLLPIPFRLLLITTPLVTLTAAAARAAPADPDPRELEAKRLCDAGQVRAGVALLAQLHVETLNPLHVYRQALCFQHNSQDEGAIDRYREYLRRSREVSARTRAWIETRIRELEFHRRPLPTPAPSSSDEAPPAGLRPVPAPPTVPPDLTSTTASVPPGLAASLTPIPRDAGIDSTGAAAGSTRSPRDTPTPLSGSRRTAPVAEARGQSWQRFSSLVLATGAGAALGTAVTFHIAREDGIRQYNRTCFPNRLSDCDDMQSRFKLAQTGAIVGYLAAALLTGGSTLFYLMAPESRRFPQPVAAREPAARSTLAARPALTCQPSLALEGVACGGRF